MRSLCLIALIALIALASTVSAGSIRPVACPTTTAEDPGLRTFVKDMNAATCASVGLPKSCTDAEVKLKDPTKTVWPNYQDYSATFYCSAVKDHAAQGIASRTAKGLPDAYRAASPAVQAQVDALLGITAP